MDVQKKNLHQGLSYFVRLAVAITCISALCLAVWAQRSADRPPLPYRFLFVISEQWKDPASEIIEGGGEFQSIAALLKSWGLPFDILRLDQQRIDKYHVLDRAGHPLHGTIIWDADPQELREEDVSLVRELVQDHGVGLLILGNSVAAPELSNLAGLRYVSEYKSPETLTFKGDHFITRGLAGREQEFLLGAGFSTQSSKVIAEEATVVATRRSAPFLTVRQFANSGRVAWLGAERAAAQFQKPVIRDLLKRSLVWVQGYALYAEYRKSVILALDDMGTSDKTFLSYWHYRTPTEEDIGAGLIAPLKQRQAVLNLMVNTGYVDRKTQRVLNPWEQRVVDEIDGKTIHDFASTKRGIVAGVKEGVFEIQSHGWTHMLPDLYSPPGPFWTAPIDGVGSLDWYNEFRDRLRNREVPAATQRFHLQKAIEYIRKDFGATPLCLIAGGGEYSKSFPNHTGRIAANLGFGLAELQAAIYLSPNLVISLEPVVRRTTWSYDKRLRAAEIPWSIDGPFWVGLHDRDIALEIDSVKRLLADLGDDVRYMTANEYAGYLHAQIERDTGAQLALIVNYDDHYCRYFQSRPSTWVLHLSDEMRQSLKQPIPEKQIIEIPKGLGRHRVIPLSK